MKIRVSTFVIFVACAFGELFALGHIIFARSYDEGAFWFAAATYAAVLGVATTQINAGQSMFKSEVADPEKKGTP